MTGFFIKKAFFDGWDNLISLVLLNLGYLVVLLAIYGAIELFALSVAAGLTLLVLAVALHSFYTGIVSVHVKEYAWYKRPSFADFTAGCKQIWRHALLHFGISLILLSLMILIIPFYLSYGSLIPFSIAMILFWITLALYLAMMFYYPLASQMPGDKPIKTLKKAFIIFIDNIGFSLFFGVYHIVTLMFTIFFATIIPGMSGIQLSRQVAVKLLLMKYDYLENEQQTTKKHIPWDSLLFDEQEKIGKRTLKGMIFPWKD
jgi:hypothetical protein